MLTGVVAVAVHQQVLQGVEETSQSLSHVSPWRLEQSGWDCSEQNRSDSALADRGIAIVIYLFFLPKKVPKAE